MGLQEESGVDLTPDLSLWSQPCHSVFKENLIIMETFSDGPPDHNIG